MILEDYIPNNKTEFLEGVYQVARKLGIYPEYLMAVMWFESKLKPTAVNSYTNATGLIQFMPSTAIGLGTTVAQLKQMSNVDQLHYVYEYLKQYKNDMYTLDDVYLAVFYPAAIGQPDYYAIGGATLAKQNSIFDLDGNNQVTKGEVLEALYNKLPADVAETIKKKS